MKPKLTIKENFDEDDLSDDVDDEVFVRDGKRCMINIEKHKGAELPLMPERRKSKLRQNLSSPEICNRQPCNIYNCLVPVYFGVAAIISIAFLLLLYIFLVDKLPVILGRSTLWSTNSVLSHNTTAPCTDFKLNQIWAQNIPTLLSDSQIKLVDIDNDTIDDIIIGTGTELEDALNSQRVCSNDYKKNDIPCLGGVIALNGKTGSMLWKIWLTQMVLSVHCDFDITSDSIPDCVVTGKEGLLLTISGGDGSVIWERKSGSNYELHNVLIIRDFNEDGYQDILASHYSKSNKMEAQSCILLISGKNGKILNQLQLSPDEPILNAPQLIFDIDGEENILIVTGDLNRPGGLYIFPIRILLMGDNSNMKPIHKSDSGILAAPILVDVNSNGVLDIIFTTSNALFALDGSNYSCIWNASLHTFVPDTYQITITSSATPTYFDDDTIPDFLMTFSVGSTFPEYYYSVVLILNGKNGQSLLNKPITRSGVADIVGGISLTFNGFGNDAFIYWMSSCKENENAVTPFTFSQKDDRLFFADLCYLRFNSSSQIQLYALNQHVEPPGVLLKSESWTESWGNKFNNGIDVSNEQATLLYKINADDRPKIFHQQQVPQNNLNSIGGKKILVGENGRTWSNKWKLRKPGLESSGESGSPMNDNLPEQIQTGDYEPETYAGRDEREFDISGVRRQRLKRNLVPSILQNIENKMLPKVSASGVLSKAFEGPDNGIDLIIMHYEVRAINDVCINTKKEQKCSPQNEPSVKHYGFPVADKIQEQFVEHNALFPNKKSKFSQISSNLYISRHHLTCSCVYLKPEHEAKCAKILSYEKQNYPAYMGKFGNSAFTKKDIVS